MSLVMFFLAWVCGILFWVWVIRAIIAIIRKEKFGKNNIIALILFGLFGWIFFFLGMGSFVGWVISTVG